MDVPRIASFTNIRTIAYILMHLDQIKIIECAIGFGSLIFLFAIARIEKYLEFKLYPVLMCLSVTTFLSSYLSMAQEYGVVIVGDIPSGMPKFHVPWSLFLIESITPLSAFYVVLTIFPYILILTLITHVTSLSICNFYPSKISSSPNQQLLLLSLITLVCSFLSCMIPSASISRSALLYRVKAHSPIASGVVGLIVLSVLLWWTSLVHSIPMACLGSIIVFCLSPTVFKKNVHIYLLINDAAGDEDDEVDETRWMKTKKFVGLAKDAIIFWTTVSSVILFDASIGILVGMGASAVLNYILSEGIKELPE